MNKNILISFYFLICTSLSILPISSTDQAKQENMLLRIVEITKTLKTNLPSQSTTKSSIPQSPIEKSDKEPSNQEPIEKTETQEPIKELTFTKPTENELKQAEILTTILKKYIDENPLTHIHFTKNEHAYKSYLQAAINYLMLIKNIFLQEEKEQPFQRIDIAQKEFLNAMNYMYAQTFKPALLNTTQDAHSQFLCIKHRFKNPDDATKIILLPEEEALIVLTELILLWEIYKKLFPKSETILSKAITMLAPNIHGINLPYFKTLHYSVNNWIEQTKDAGFNAKSEFSEEIDLILDEILPQEDHNQPSKFTIAKQTIRNTLHTTTQRVKSRAKATQSWFKKVWENIKSALQKEAYDVTQELDEL